MSIKRLILGVIILVVAFIFYTIETSVAGYPKSYRTCVENEATWPINCTKDMTFVEYQYDYSRGDYIKDNLFSLDNMRKSLVMDIGLIGISLLLVFYPDKRTLNTLDDSYIKLGAYLSFIIGSFPFLLFILNYLHVIKGSSFLSSITSLGLEVIYTIGFLLLGAAFIVSGINKLQYIKQNKLGGIANDESFN